MSQQYPENEMPTGENDAASPGELENMGDVFRATAKTSPARNAEASETPAHETENMGDMFRATAGRAAAESTAEQPSGLGIDASHTGKMPGEEDEMPLAGHTRKMPGE